MAEPLIGKAVQQALQEAMRIGNVPGLVLAASHGQRPVEYLALGADARGQPLAPESLFPVASITKLATALAVLRLADAGALAIDDQLSDHLPDAIAAQFGVTLTSLLCHSSGLPQDLDAQAAPYAPGLSWPLLRAACMETPLEAAPATRVQYSNVGYGLLAAVVERHSGQPFAAALQELVLAPLGVAASLGTEPPRPPAAISDVRGRYRGGDLEPFNSAFWRSLALPWAGLLTNADGALRLARAFQGHPTRLLQESTRAAATRSHTGSLAGGFVAPLLWDPCPWGLGPDLRGEKSPHWAPTQAGPDSFGHSGASGCLAWVAPAHDLAWAILGARTADSGWLLRRAPAIGAALLERVG